MSLHITQRVFLAAVLATGAGSAQATTITFEDVPENIFWNPNLYPDKPSAFRTGDYVFTMSSGLGFTFNGERKYSNVAYNGTAIFDLVGTATMHNVFGHRFSVESLEFATFITAQRSTVRFTGTRADGSSITRDYSTTLLDYYATDDDFRTQKFNGFNNLTSFEMQLVMQPETTYAVVFDNILVDEKKNGQVPEPSTPASFAIGLGMLALLARRKKTL